MRDGRDGVVGRAVLKTSTRTITGLNFGVIILKNVQISYDLFMKLLKYHCFEIYECEGDIKRELEKKLNAVVKRKYYTDYKTADSEKEREEARRKYLDEAGIHKDFRW